MKTEIGTIELLARTVGEALKGLETRFQGDAAGDLFENLGIQFPPGFLAQGSLASALNGAGTAAAGLSAPLLDLANAIAAGNDIQTSAAGAQVLLKIGLILQKLADVGIQLGSAGAAFPGLTPAQRAQIQSFAGELPGKLTQLLVLDWIETRMPGLPKIAGLTGIRDFAPVHADPDNPLVAPHIPRAFHLNRLGLMLFNPLEYLKVSFGFGRSDFDGLDLFRRIKLSLDSPSLIIDLDETPGNVSLEAPWFRLRVDSSVTPPVIVLEIPMPPDWHIYGGGQLIKPLALQFDARGSFPYGTQIRIAPPLDVSLHPPAGAAKLNLQGGLVLQPTDGPIVLFGVTGGTKLQAQKISINLGLAPTQVQAGQPAISVEVASGNLTIDLSGGDGFISMITGGLKLSADFDFKLHWSPGAGFSIEGSSAIQIATPVHTSIGPISLETLYLQLGVGENGSFPIELSSGFNTQVGPLDVTVDRIGLIALMTFPDQGGNLGLANLAFRFKPPNGVGLSLDAGGFKGGGFLMFDQEKGEYAGALELDFKGMFSVKAIGIINTKMPDGSPGYSLLIVISAEFTPIQLSFGFTLNGVGGIIGLNRTLVVAALAEGIRTNAIKSILFPENVVANISRIISDIKQFFPPQNDHFLIGPMAKLGWGTPSLITLELGLLLDLPNPMFAIVGVLKAVLPNEDLPILRLQVNFIGILDFERGYVFFRADLYDSRLLIYSITGSMAFLVSWGEQQTFALSVGGFHPDFRDFPSIPALPDGFRNMARIGISLLSDDNPRLKVESYFAVTSNTVQFGARVELYAEAAGFNVYGFLGYDVLFQFDPFRFIADLYGGIALREGTSVIAGISISAKLSGPNPWDALGDASLTILFFEISVGFHVTWGDPPPAISPATEDLLKLLERELADTRNWRAELPSNNHLHVTLRKIDPVAGEELLVIQPAGVLTFSQRSLPLEDYVIQKFGNKKPLNENKFKLTNANSNGTIIPADYQGVREQFAPANFTELSDSDKLSRHSFDRLPSGFKLTATLDLQVAGVPVTRDVVYELSYLRRKRLEFKGLVKLAVRAYDRLVKGSAARQSVLSLQQNRISLNAPAQVVLQQESFAIANTADLRSHVQGMDGPVLFATQAEAYQRHQELIRMNPALAGQIQVVSHFELNQS